MKSRPQKSSQYRKVKSRHQPVVGTSITREESRDVRLKSRHQNSLQCRQVKSQRQIEVATSEQLISRTTKSRRPSEVATSSQDRNTQMKSRHEQTNGPVNLKTTNRCIEVRAQLPNPINTQLLQNESSSWRLRTRSLGSLRLMYFNFLFLFLCFAFILD